MFCTPRWGTEKIPSAIAVTIMGAEWRPKGRTLSKYRSPCHRMARSSLSSGATGTMRNASLTSALARRAPWPRWRMASATWSTEMYEIEQSSLSMKSFMLYPSGPERSTIGRHFPGL